MSTALQHSPADVVAQLLMDLGGVSDPVGDPGQPWPCWVSSERSEPDDAVTVYDTVPQDDGRAMFDGETFHHYGFQVRVRSTTHKDGFAKADALHTLMDEGFYDRVVTVDGVQYRVHSISGTTLLSLGRNVPNDKRSLFTINAKASLKPV